MPLYEFNCPVHGIFELLLGIHDNCDVATCPSDDVLLLVEDLESDTTSFCGLDSPSVPSVCTMRPDKYWAGQVVHGQYVTSSEQVNKNIEPATRETAEYIQKQNVKIKQELAETQSNNLKKFLQEQLAGVEISPDGNTVKQKRKYEDARANTTDSTGAI